MAKQSNRQNLIWQRSFQQHAQSAVASSQKSNIKVFIAGHYSVVKVFGKPVQIPGASLASPGCGRKGGQRPVCPNGEKSSKKPRSKADMHRRYVKRKQSELKLLIQQNFTPITSAFVTLTFGDKTTDLAFVKREFQKLSKRLRKHAQGVRYLAVPEKHDDQSWHVHLLIDRILPLTSAVSAAAIEAGTIRSRRGSWECLWKIGQVHQEQTNKGGNLGASIAAYVMKNSAEAELIGHHVPWRSDNLEAYEQLDGLAALQWVQEMAASGALPIYSYTCQNLEHIEWMAVYEFCPDRKAALLDKPWWLYKNPAA